MNKKCFLVAGGTGGHINAALAFGEYLGQKNWNVSYVTGTRPLDEKLFAGKGALHLPAMTIRSKSILKLIKAIWQNLKVQYSLYKKIKLEKPDFIFGAGGYICGPSLLAGYLAGVPVYTLEQNSVVGLTNKLTSYFSKLVFTQFNNVIGLPKSVGAKVRQVGNPIRSSFLRPFPMRESSDETNILVFGGSLGATRINSLISSFLTKTELKLNVRHQTGIGKEDDKVTNRENIKHEVLPYFENIDQDYDWADIIICRAGASTITELKFVQKPCILIPYPEATDNHQYWNAIRLKEEVGFRVDVHTADELKANSCRILEDIIKHIRDDKSVYELRSLNNPCDALYDEIKKTI